MRCRHRRQYIIYGDAVTFAHRSSLSSGPSKPSFCEYVKKGISVLLFSLLLFSIRHSYCRIYISRSTVGGQRWISIFSLKGRISPFFIPLSLLFPENGMILSCSFHFFFPCEITIHRVHNNSKGKNLCFLPFYGAMIRNMHSMILSYSQLFTEKCVYVQ